MQIVLRAALIEHCRDMERAGSSSTPGRGGGLPGSPIYGNATIKRSATERVPTARRAGYALFRNGMC